jgi:molybdenum cofactor cytidylyltransferase
MDATNPGAAGNRAKPAKPLRIGAIILAAGASTRMGEPKQLLPVGGKPLVARAAEAALASPVWPVIVVLGANAELIRPSLTRLPVLTVENTAWAEGMAASIRAGIAALEQFSRTIDGALLALCDQPAFSPAVINRLLAAQLDSGRSIVAARYAGRDGAPAIFLRRHFGALAALTGEAGARSLLHPGADLVAVELPELACDVDTREDYAALHSQSHPKPK